MTTNRLHYLVFALLMFSLLRVANGQVLNYETSITIAKSGKKTTERKVLIQVNNKDENWLSHVELSHDPKQKFIFGYAHILDKEGNMVRKLKKKELITRSNLSYQSFYQDDLITEFDLYWNQYPYIIEYAYTIREDEYLYIAWWTPLILKNASTIKSSLKVNMPDSLKVKVYNSDNLFFEESEEDNRRILSWSSNMVSKLQNEVYSPETDKMIPVVKLVPNDFIYGLAGKTDSWASLGLWFDQLNQGLDQLTLQEKLAIEKLVDGVKNRDEIIKVIYYYLQDQTKYINVAIDVGGLKSYPASYVCENKHGDCKALTTYMKAALKSVGIESFYSIIKAGENYTEIDTTIPSQQFNHVILMVPNEKDTLWLENTSNSLPFNYLGTFTQNRYALTIHGKKSRLVKTPKLSIDEVLIERNYYFQVTSNNKVLANLDLILRGNSFENFRHFISKKDKEQQMNEISRHHGIMGFNVDSWEVIDFHRDSTFLHLHIAGTSSSVLREIGTFRVINPLMVKLPDFKRVNKRMSNVVINFPISTSDISAYNLESFKEKEIQVPEGISIENDYGAYRAAFHKENNELIVVEKFTLFANNISLDNYKGLCEFIDSINTYKKNTAILIK